MASNKDTKKRGRPLGSTKPDKAILTKNKLGITKEPSQDNRYIELQFHHPKLWKHIFDVIKSQKARYTRIVFDKENVTFTSNGRLNRTCSEFKFVGSKMMRYYCEAPNTIYLDPDNIYNHMKKLNDKYVEVHFFLKRGFQSEKMTILLKNISGVCEEVSISISTNVPADLAISPIPEVIPYMMKFDITTDTLKSVIKDYDSSVSRITFTKAPGKDENIKISYSFENEVPVSGTWILPKSEHTEEKMDQNTLLRWEVHLNLIHPILKFQLAKDLVMSCHNTEPAVFSNNYHDHMIMRYMIKTKNGK